MKDKITPATCANCACGVSRHGTFGTRPCLIHEYCEAYRPLGSKMAETLNGGGFEFSRAKKGRKK